MTRALDHFASHTISFSFVSMSADELWFFTLLLFDGLAFSVKSPAGDIRN